jgi:hypothetical protein
MRKELKILRKVGLIALVLSIYPLCILIYTWSYVLRSDLAGGRHGPLDAYRHALASAAVSYTLGDMAVGISTKLMESKGRTSNTMDRHNNLIGARIGASVNSFKEIEPLVRQYVLDGTINTTNDTQITWLPTDKWHDGRFW